MEYTKGKWWVEVGDDETSVESKAQTICTNVSNCDAHLIAAAPDMYEWIKNIGLHLAVNYNEENEPFFIIDNEYLAKGHTLLAKAGGTR